MILTAKQCDLLLNMVNASLSAAFRSGIPIHKDYYDDIEIIKHELYQEMQEAVKRENKEVCCDFNR